MSAPEPKDVLQALIDMFWNDNTELQGMILRDVYAHGRITEATNEAAQIAVEAWLARPAVSNGEFASEQSDQG